MKMKNIKVNGCKGTWCVVESTYHYTGKVFLLENEQDGDMPFMIVDKDMNILVKKSHYGFEDLDECPDWHY